MIDSLPMTQQLNSALAGRYEIEREIGQGGMATVYLARDVRHHRNVALKVLKADLRAVLGPERFLSEIAVTANLQHPNLVPLFESGAAGELLFYVMPLVDGESLRARLDREKLLPVDDAIRIATAVASALDYAHRRGVIHRDLKPENILLHDGQPLVADFGIALAVSNAGGSRLTQTGISLGTPQYMSPEQAAGDGQIDARSDIYSLGAVAYEMLTGEPPHRGTTHQAVIARVLTEPPRLIRVARPAVPHHVEGAVMRALEKVAADRWSSAREFAEALTGERAVRFVPVSPSGTLPASSPAPAARKAAIGMAALALVGLGVTAGIVVMQRPASFPTVQAEFGVVLPEGLEISTRGAANGVALSADGSILVFQGADRNGEQALYLRRLSDRAVSKIRGTEGAARPALSHDGQDVFFINRGTWRVSTEGGLPERVAETSGTLAPGEHGLLLVVRGDGSETSGIWIRDNATTAPRLLVAPDTSRQHISFGFPFVLPGNTAALIAIRRGANVVDSTILGVVTIPDGEVRELGIKGLNPQYSSNGYLFYATLDGDLKAQRFSPSTLEADGNPVTVARQVLFAFGGAAAYAVADNGTIAFFGGPTSYGERRLVSVTRTGVERPLYEKSGYYQTPRVAPGGERIAFTIFTGRGLAGQTTPNPDIWTWDVRSQTLSRATSDARSFRPEWMPDGKHFAFIEAPVGDTIVRSRALNDGDSATTIARAPALIRQLSIAKVDGLLALGVGTGDVDLARPDQLTSAQRILSSDGDVRAPVLSPNGRFIAYSSRRTGRSEVYLRPVDAGSADVRVSVDGGGEPMWSSSEAELFYRGSGYLMSARIAAGGIPTITRHDTLFPDKYVLLGSPANYDVFPDGKTFVMLSSQAERDARELVVITNWSVRR